MTISTTKQEMAWRPAHNWIAFILLLVVQLWITHTLGFMVHEYAHAVSAWLLGWKQNPLALHYGHATIGNFLLQRDIDENVNYAPIFASGHGWQAGMIAAAGAAIGNGLISYPISLWGFFAARKRDSRTWAMFSYWLCVMSVGNFIDYVPVRTFSFREDMSTVAKGFNCSPWWILLCLGVPFAIALAYFFLRFQPRALLWLFPDSPARQRTVVIVTAAAVFGYFGLAGWWNSGSVSHWISFLSVCFVFPSMAVAGCLGVKRTALEAAVTV